jgi:hypothetical protein
MGQRGQVPCRHVIGVGRGGALLCCAKPLGVLQTQSAQANVQHIVGMQPNPLAMRHLSAIEAAAQLFAPVLKCPSLVVGVVWFMKYAKLGFGVGV